MSRRPFAQRALFVAPGLAVATVGLVLQLTSSWRLVRIPWLDPDRSFEDLWQVTSNADCAASDPHWSPATSTCDPLGRPYNYPTVWARVFGHLGLGGADTQWLGIVLIVVFGLTLVSLGFLTLRQAPTTAVIALTVSAVSPPALVAMERGNVDLLVWPWVVLALWLMTRDRWRVAAPVLAVAVYLKFFPLGALTGALGRHRRRGLALVGASIPSLIALAVEADQFAGIRSRTPQVPIYSWGVSVLPLAGRLERSSPVPPYLAGLAFFAVCVGVGLLCLKLFGAARAAVVLERTRLAVSADPVGAVVVSAGLGLALFTYLLGTSFDYRMVALTVLAAGFARSWNDPIARGAVVALIVLQYLSYPLGYPRELLGDLAWAVVAPALAILAAWCWIPPVRAWITAARAAQPSPAVATAD